ncbi:gamma-butyrobetaine dioxygenase [Aphomia sociella]
MYVLKRIQCLNKVFKQANVLKCATKNNYQNFQLKRWTHDYLKLDILGKNLSFPYVWLRDNCQCEKCFHQSAKSRILDWSNFDVNVKPQDVVMDEYTVQVTWTDGHKSKYDLNWLKFRSFTTENQQMYKEAIYKPKKATWKGEDFQEICSKHDYKEILNSDRGLYNWLHKLSVYGVALIQNTPNSESSVDAVVERVGFTKRTHYGIKFVVQHVANTSNVAYLSSNLQMHVDLPYYEYCPGANLLHCLVQTKSYGGENLLSDGHYVAQYIKKNHPDQYKLLTEIDVEWSDIGIENSNEFFKLHRAPVICLDKAGDVTRINFSVPQRGSNFPCPIELVKPWYEAHGLFLALNHRFSAKFKTKEGDILVFDNIRLLHGRRAYEDNNNNVRKLIGAYLDWDEIYSRLRCLKVKLKNEDIIY